MIVFESSFFFPCLLIYLFILVFFPLHVAKEKELFYEEGALLPAIKNINQSDDRLHSLDFHGCDHDCNKALSPLNKHVTIANKLGGGGGELFLLTVITIHLFCHV